MIWLTLAILAVACLYGAHRYRQWRDACDLRIRNEKLARYTIIPQKGTRTTFSHNPEDL